MSKLDGESCSTCFDSYLITTANLNTELIEELDGCETADTNGTTCNKCLTSYCITAEKLRVERKQGLEECDICNSNNKCDTWMEGYCLSASDLCEKMNEQGLCSKCPIIERNAMKRILV